MERKFKIGDKVIINSWNEILTIVGYEEGNSEGYLTKGKIDGHCGGCTNAIKEDGTRYIPSGEDYWWANDIELTLIERKEMEKGIIKLSLEDAKKLYNEGGQFRTIALSAYSEDELKLFKEGDFVVSGWGNIEPENRDSGCLWIAIIKQMKSHSYKYHSLYFIKKSSIGSSNVKYDNEASSQTFTRLATEEEKQQLLNAMHEDGKNWDPINKKVIPYRWRAKLNGCYYYVVDFSECRAYVTKSIEDDCGICNGRFEKHNYFKTKEEAQEVADKINNIFKEL